MTLFEKGGIERVSPVQLVPSKRTLTAYLCCCERFQLTNKAPHKASLQAVNLKSCSLLLALSAQRHEDFPRSNFGSDLPVCALRSRASPASRADSSPQIS